MQDPHDNSSTKEMAMNSLDSVTRYRRAAESGFEFHHFFPKCLFMCQSLDTQF